ncbi:MAG: ABC transporter substrate-binding protein [Erythrobacter sp.]
MRPCASIILFLAPVLTLAACGPSASDGPVQIAIIGEPSDLFDEGVRLSPAAQHLRGASTEGLVSLDATGQVIPALAERWIVTDDGTSYFFRLRERDWPSDDNETGADSEEDAEADGDPVTASDVRRALQELLRQSEGTSLGLDLAKVTDIRVMTERVVELRLSSPMPEFLRLLAQPELGIVKNGSGAGPMIATREDGVEAVTLSALPPQQRGLPRREDWEERSRPITVRAMPVNAATDAFFEGNLDLVANGRLAEFPQVEVGPLSRGTIQVDPALGLMGLVFRSDSGVLADPARREALSMAIDRAELIAPLGLGGWQPTSWIVPPALFDAPTFGQSRWGDQSMEQRRATAAARMAEWRAQSGEDEIVLRVGLPEGPGSDLLFDGISQSWADIGVRAVQVRLGEGAELEWRDRLARYSSPRWFLNQFNCELEIGLCSEEADALVRRSLDVKLLGEKERILAEAHTRLVAAEVYIPFGAPVRWSLVRGAIAAYEPNPWGLHPLFPLSGPTN